RVHVRLGEHPALPGHRVDLDARVAHVAQLFGGYPELRIDLVDDRAGPPGALVVHRRDLLLLAGLLVGLEDDDLGVLAAQLHHRAHLRMQLLHGERDGVDLLYELRADAGGQTAPARPGDEDPEPIVGDRKLGLDAGEKLERLLRLLGVVPLVVRPEDGVSDRVDDHRLDGGRADVEADVEQFVVVRGRHQPTLPATATPPARPRSAAVRSATWHTKFAAVPTTPFVWGTRYIPLCSSGWSSA